MKKTYWQAELLKHDEPYDIDFPRRTTSAESLDDARKGLSRLTDNERRNITGGASEWIGDEDEAESTGNWIEA